MPNMSYCRFENTVNDMQDCLNAIEDREVSNLSDYEVKALQHFLTMENIFKTEYFYQKFEETARKNIQKEIELL